MNRFYILFLFLLFFYSCSSSKDKQSNQRWASGNYKQIQELKLDVDAVQKAFQSAESPSQFEKKVNEIYTGDEVISINVADKGNKNQIVSLYIDNNPENGQMEKAEKILALNRTIDSDNNQVQVSRTGYGPYAYYSSTTPLLYAAAGSMITYWVMSRSFYSTPVDRFSDIRSHRNSYRQTSNYQSQKVKTKTFSNNFNKNAPDNFKKSKKTFSQSSSSQGKKSNKSGSWFSGSKKAKSPSPSRRRSFKFRGFGRRRR